MWRMLYFQTSPNFDFLGYATQKTRSFYLIYIFDASKWRENMAQDAKIVNKLDILSYVCHLKSYYSSVLKMWRMGLFICHKQ